MELDVLNQRGALSRHLPFERGQAAGFGLRPVQEQDEGGGSETNFQERMRAIGVAPLCIVDVDDDGSSACHTAEQLAQTREPGAPLLDRVTTCDIHFRRPSEPGDAIEDRKQTSECADRAEAMRRRQPRAGA